MFCGATSFEGHLVGPKAASRPPFAPQASATVGQGRQDQRAGQSLARIPETAMPSKGPRICGCGDIVAPGSRCTCQAARDRERKARFDAKRPSAAARGYDTDWRKLRARHLANYPACVRCGKPATDVDHIIPRRLAPERRLDPTNLQSLCKSHHSGAKQREERRHSRGAYQ
ncbi:HNH endonuclease [Litorisediminicola beolgyonensis]|uniref:HNH endonuclease n=1 Tax=Litorisediminicola beolgyonensis TaxID=1173614 RepID=A0ABW3ZEA4_9RHOB